MTVYLLHFEKKYKHARHYIGGTTLDVDDRLNRHVRGHGSPLVKAVVDAGIDIVIARVWENKDWDFEKRMKSWKKAQQLCPICRKERKRV